MIFQALWPLRLPEIEEPNMVRTSVGAESRSYTTVVDLDIHAFVIVVRGINWAYWLTRSASTMLAHHRDETSFNVRELSLPIPFYSDPLDCSSLIEMFF